MDREVIVSYPSSMTITVRAVGRFKEVTFHDFEETGVRARSGLLDELDAADLSYRLRKVADELCERESVDENQITLPFFAPRHEMRTAVGY